MTKRVEVGTLVAISLMVREPYLRSADRRVSRRLAQVVRVDPDRLDPGRIEVEDEFHERHVLDGPYWEQPVADAATPRWIAQGAVPAWAVGDELDLDWLRRNATQPEAAREPTVGIVVAGTGTSVILSLAGGERIEVARANGHQMHVERDAPRWVISFGRPA